jgi:hypothetical protein
MRRPSIGVCSAAFLALGLTVFLLLSGCDAWTKAQGTIRDSAGKPIPDAIVTIKVGSDSREFRSAEDGRYMVLMSQPPWKTNVILTVSKPGYILSEKKLKAPSNYKELDVVLEAVQPPGIRVELNPEKPFWLHVTVRSGAETTATFFKSQLPWGNRYSMVIVAVTPHGGCLDKELPIDDPGPETISLAPRESLSGDIDLRWFIRDLSSVTKKSDLQLFWAYQAPKEVKIAHWSGGWILIPRQK